MTNKSEETYTIEFLERECQRTAIAANVAHAEHKAWAARLLAAYDEVTARRNAALEKRREDMRPTEF
jgi:hypothetical protein